MEKQTNELGEFSGNLWEQTEEEIKNYKCMKCEGLDRKEHGLYCKVEGGKN